MTKYIQMNKWKQILVLAHVAHRMHVLASNHDLKQEHKTLCHLNLVKGLIVYVEPNSEVVIKGVYQTEFTIEARIVQNRLPQMFNNCLMMPLKYHWVLTFIGVSQIWKAISTAIS